MKITASWKVTSRIDVSDELAASIFSVVECTNRKIEAVGSTETLVHFYQNRRRQIPKDHSLHLL
jgi:hypothetical protein